MDSGGLSVVRELFEHIDANVGRGEAEQASHARRVFEELGRAGGTVESIGKPMYRKTRLNELGRWTGDPWGQPSYGLDASTTRPLEFNNGLVVDTAYAKVGVSGADVDRTLEQDGTVKTVVYLSDDESTLHPTEVDGETARGEVIRYPDTGRSARLPKRIATAAQYLAEGEHLQRHVDRIDGICFVDGAVYPLGVVYWLLLDELGRSTPAGRWDVPERILANYAAVVDTQHERGLPVVGVVKTSTADELLTALEDKLSEHEVTDEHGNALDVPWNKDHQFVGEVLRDDSLEHLTYTSWFVQEQLTIDGRGFDVLGPVRENLEHGPPERYRRAFFYARLPKTGGVLRVEAPYLMVEDETRRQQIQYKTLKEIAKQRDVPGAVKRADRIARITTDNRESIRELITTSESAHDYNRDGRWSDIEDTNTP